MFKIRSVFFLLAVLVATQALAADVTGVVLDSGGSPVAGARVGSSFALSKTAAQTKVQIGYGEPAVVTDATGRFSIPAASIGYSKVVVAAGPDGSLGFGEKSFPAQTTIRLARASSLSVEVTKPFGKQSLHSFDLNAFGSTVGYGAVTKTAEFAVPQGAFELALSDPESVAVTRKIMPSSSSGSRLRIALQPTQWVKGLDKPAPVLTPTDVQNWPAGRPFSALHGKWVLVTFWATWCQPCVEEMPKLISFYENHTAQRDRFEIVAIHSPDGKSFAGIQPAYERLEKSLWNGKSLPFPLVFDATGNTQKRWGIEAYPTSLLIDPAGRLVGWGTIEDLKAKITG
ncbi:MAG TPA: redoxin domain-containing protein [Steroidobacteraceae bacterium]|nr:redoxin domain-containing protein [Steroidobacteraceae bacterium]